MIFILSIPTGQKGKTGYRINYNLIYKRYEIST